MNTCSLWGHDDERIEINRPGEVVGSDVRYVTHIAYRCRRCQREYLSKCACHRVPWVERVDYVFNITSDGTVEGTKSLLAK